MLLPDSKQKEYEQNAHTPFVFRQVKPALWKAPLGRLLFWTIFLGFWIKKEKGLDKPSVMVYH